MHEEVQEMVEIFQESFLDGTLEDIMEEVIKMQENEKILQEVLPFFQLEDILLICSQFYLKKQKMEDKMTGYQFLVTIAHFLSLEQLTSFFQNINLKFEEEFFLFSIMDRYKIWKKLNLSYFKDERTTSSLYILLENTKHPLEVQDFIICQLEERNQMEYFLKGIAKEKFSKSADILLLYIEKLFQDSPNDKILTYLKEFYENTLSKEKEFVTYSEILQFYERFIKIQSRYLLIKTFIDEFKEILEKKDTSTILSIPIEKVKNFKLILALSSS